MTLSRQVVGLLGDPLSWPGVPVGDLDARNIDERRAVKCCEPEADM